MIITHKVTMDMMNPGQLPRIHAVQDDQYSRNLELTLLSGGEPWQIPGDVTVVVRYCKPDGTGGEYNTLPDDTTAWSAEGNILTVALAPQVLTVPGMVTLSASLISGTRQITTFTVCLHVKPGVKSCIADSVDYINIVTIGTVQTLEPGQGATASISGTRQALVLDLGIPQGRTPEKGVDYWTEADVQELAETTGAMIPAVRYTAQSVTEKEKAQARSNIGATSAADVRKLYEEMTAQSKEITIEEGVNGFWDMTNNWIPASGVCAKRTNEITVKPGEGYLYTGRGAENIASVIWYDAAASILSYEQYEVETGMRVLIAPENAASARFYSYAYTDSVDTIALEVTWLPQGDDRVIVIESQENGYWGTDGVWINDVGGSKRTKPILVTKEDRFHYTGKGIWNTVSIIWYDINGGILSAEQYHDGNFENVSIVVSPPTDAMFVRFYSYNVAGLEYCTLLVTYESDDSVTQWLQGSNYLWNKKYVACGDSFTAGDFTNAANKDEAWDEATQTYKTYPWWIADRNRMILVNEAICGTTMYNNGDENAFSVNRYKEVPTDADYITLCFGLNETTATIGTLEDTTNETVIGAWNIVLEYLITNMPYAKIGIILPDAWCSEEMRAALISVAEYWGIPYLDLKGDTKVPLMIGGRYGDTAVSSKAVALRNAAFQVTDTDSHPNLKAHEYRSTVIENFLRSL